MLHDCLLEIQCPRIVDGPLLPDQGPLGNRLVVVEVPVLSIPPLLAASADSTFLATRTPFDSITTSPYNLTGILKRTQHRHHDIRPPVPRTRQHPTPRRDRLGSHPSRP